jgi:hypothetical protein
VRRALNGCTHASRTHRSHVGLIHRLLNLDIAIIVRDVCESFPDSTFIVARDALTEGVAKITVGRQIAGLVSARPPCCLEPSEVGKEQSAGCIATAISSCVFVSAFLFTRWDLPLAPARAFVPNCLLLANIYDNHHSLQISTIISSDARVTQASTCSECG